MKPCPYCKETLDGKHEISTLVGGFEVVGCPMIAEGARYLLAKSKWKPEPRCIMSEITDRHMDHVKHFGDRRNPVAVYLGKEEAKLLHADAQSSRYFGTGSSIEEFLKAMSIGEAVIYTQCGKLTLYAVDAPRHLAIGGAK